MKKIISILLLTIPFVVSAQIDRTKVPEPGPAPEINLAGYESFTLDNGLKVFVVENHKLPRVSFSLSIDRDPVVEGDKAGYISIAGQLLKNGTTTRTKAELDEEIDFIGASLGTSSTGIFGSSLKKHTDKLLELFTDILYNPAFSEDELEKIKKQTISGLQANKEDPNAIAANVRSVLRYGKDHPYGELTTEETVSNVDVESVRNYYKTYFKPNISYLAIVGNINKKEAQKLARKYFSKWEKGEVPKFQYKVPVAPEINIVAIVDRPQAVQSVINITYPVILKPGHPDVIKSRVMNTILGGGFSSNLMQNLRETYGYTYGAGSSLSNDELIGSFTASASVRNEVTDSSVVQFFHELKRIRNEQVPDDQLKSIKNYITGGFARSLESPQTIANFAINIEKYGLPKDYYANYLKNIASVSKADVQEMAQKYILPDNSYILVVGKAAEVADKLKQFGEVKYYDIYGNEYDPTKAVLPEGLTAKDVIDAYIEALGGKQKLMEVRDIRIELKAEAMGQVLNMKSIKKSPDKMVVEIKMGEVVVNKIVTDGNKVSVTQMGQPVPVDEKTRQETLSQAPIFPELFYQETGVTTKLLSLENVDGVEAYALEVANPDGSRSIDYFSVKSGLKIRTSKVIETPQGTMNQNSDYKDYRSVDGVMVPHSVTQNLGPQKILAEITLIEINKNISDDLFKIE